MNKEQPQTYLVGGAVRDQLLGLEISERDWVVTGTTPEAMHQQGFRPVGRDFPVFIHPQSGEEYALARTERKSGRGYHGFMFNASPQVSLEEDLARRDLSINAIARDAKGQLIDPFGGIADLEARQLRHVSPAFAEDPLRVLRVARFAARFAGLGFSIAHETLALMRQMSVSGELADLTPERVWQESCKALATDHPWIYFEVLRRCGALGQVFPELNRLFGVPQPAKYHPEIDTGIHSLMSLEQVARLTRDPCCRFATLVHDLGKGETPRGEWPSHIGHEGAGVAVIERLARRLGISKKYEQLARLVSRWHLHSHRAMQLKPATLLRLFDALDLWRRPDRLEDFLVCCEADARGRNGLEKKPYPQADYLRSAFASVQPISGADLAGQGLAGAQIGKALDAVRLQALTDFKLSFSGEESPG